MAIYKALDIRELTRVGSGSVSNGGSYCSSSSVRIDAEGYVVCIAKDLNTNARVRFEFKPASKDTYQGKTYYSGYIGDYELLVPGDVFEIEEDKVYPYPRISIVEVK